MYAPAEPDREHTLFRSREDFLRLHESLLTVRLFRFDWMREGNFM